MYLVWHLDPLFASRPARGGWIEITRTVRSPDSTVSRPARGGWIEILVYGLVIMIWWVPPRKGRVD